MVALQRIVGLAGLLCMAGIAAAASVVSVSPQGEVAAVRQVVVRFSEAVVPLGDLRQGEPATLACTGAATAGNARWIDHRTWAHDFAEALPPGVRCTLKIKPGWKPLGGELTGPAEWRFSTGGPAIVRITPFQGTTIEEDQTFVVQLSGPVVDAAVPRHAWCEIEGLGEAVPVRLVGGAERDAVLKAQRLEKVADRVLLLACSRPLPNGAKVRLVWGKGIASRSDPKVLTSVEQRYDYHVRTAFTADFSCERERANAPCMPIRPLTLRFSAAVPRKLAEAVRLKGPQAAVGPKFDQDDKAAEVEAVTFAAPLPERTKFTLELPKELRDASGRALANAASFPLEVATGDAPPIAKFAAAPFGILEAGSEAVLPITLRHVQGDLRAEAAGGQVRVKTLKDEAEIVKAYFELQRLHESMLPARALGYPQSEWTETVEETDERGRTVKRRQERLVHTREVSLLARDTAARRLQLPQLGSAGRDEPRPFEVVGIPLPGPGFHVVEVESRRLGRALLDKDAPMYVRTGALVTNLGVHFKHGRENALVWVTTLDRGRPVAGADVTILTCQGKPVWSGRTDARGIAAVAQRIDPDTKHCSGSEAIFVAARKADAKGHVDLAFVFAGWSKGIEPWRFQVPFSGDGGADVRAHTVFDRTLLRAGETVSMKHFVRRETARGIAMLAPDELPTRVKIVHEGSNEEFVQPLAWNGSSRSAASSWNIPPAAKLGVYRVTLDNPGAPPARRRAWASGDFRVEEFRVPLLDARLVPPKQVQVAPREVALDVQLNYLAGGGVAQAPLRASALLRPRDAAMPGYDEFSFEPARNVDDGEVERERERGEGRLVADKIALATDRDGAARFTIKELPKITRPSELVAEVTFNDPNGEVQTVGTTLRVWPAAVVLGVKAASWAASRGEARFTVLALDTAGKPVKGQRVEVRGRVSQILSTRKRLVGGFYGYDHRTEVRDLGRLCSGSSDDRGLVLCEARLDTAGQVELIAQTRDGAGNVAEAAAGIWITKQGELWFEQDNDDRIDVLPEKKRYEGGETAKLQVRMPFREATALVAVEREGVIDTRVVTLRGDDPTFELPIDKAWAPNVYVSVLALRGRIRDVPWYSFFTWGWRGPIEWWRAFWYEGREYRAPTAMVDLAKPSFKLGMAPLKVGLAAHELQVAVSADKPQYPVRGKALVKVKVSHGGRPVAGTEVAFAAVDEGLLALRDNESWQLLASLLRERAWGVQTATAQGEIIGRRHYGRKAVAAGGGGGKGATRELFDTLLLWRPQVVLDANGEATIEVPLNDSLTSFRLVAVADAPTQQFGTGHASIKVTQDLQLLSGLPPLVRDADRFAAMLTLRNTTQREMKVRASLAGTAAGGNGSSEIVRTKLALPAQDVVVPAGGAKEVVWSIDVPAEAFSIAWEAAAEEQGGGAAKDRLKVTQLVGAAVPLRVLQATLVQLDGSVSLPVAAPADALAAGGAAGGVASGAAGGAASGAGSVKRGGLVVAAQPKLTGALPGIRRYFETYPFVCLEQKTSKAVGLRDAALWTTVANALPTYLDGDGLAGYFPPRADEPPRGSDRLTAYVLQATHEAGFELPQPARERMLDGLAAFVEGRIERKFWSPRADLDVRKLAAIEALARHGRAQPRMLGSINLTPNLWPTAAVIDWLSILRRVPNVPEQARRIDEAQAVLRARLTYAGTTLKFSTESDDFWFWLMDSADANAAKLILAVLDDPAWKDELPRLVVGALARQNRGAWLTTTANLWGSLALDKFAAKFESQRVAGRTVASAGAAPQAIDWGRESEGGKVLVPWPAGSARLTVAQEGSGRPWLTVQGLAAIPLAAPLSAGYAVRRSVTAVEQKDKGRWSRGDVIRVRLEVDAQADMTWVVVSDPVPGGATILGSGLGRDSQIATSGEPSSAAYEERGFEAFRAYYGYLPRGRHVVEYTLRLNNAGRFALPPTRVEAMYAPESFGEAPNAAVEVAP